MALTPSRPLNDTGLDAQTASIGATPAPGWTASHVAGYLQRVVATAGGTTTGTIAVAVSINGGSDVTGGALTIAAGTGARTGSVLELPLTGPNAVFINEGDFILFTPSGGGGASIQGAFVAVVRGT